ncbi:MAG: GDSL-type esterase/lipase family protein [Hyphomicrobiaceae bacterium]
MAKLWLTHVRAAALLVLAGIALASVPRTPAVAQEAVAWSSYVTPFPGRGTYTIEIAGDSWAEGLLDGLRASFEGDARVEIARRRRALTSIVRAEFEAQVSSLFEDLGRSPADVLVVMTGVGDRQSLRLAGGARFRFGSERWRTEYGKRIDQLMKLAKSKRLAVYWVGLPIVRRAEAQDDVRVINEIIREKAYLNGIRFIDTWAGFAEEEGQYSAYGPDVAGTIRLLRDGDGVHFTSAGNRKLAHFVDRQMKRDIATAESERRLPLDGGASEMARLARLAPEDSPVKKALAEAAKKRAERSKASIRAAAGKQPRGPLAPPGVQDQPADKSRVTVRVTGRGGKEESFTIDIVRPAIPAAVLAHVTRRTSPDVATPMGDTVDGDTIGGLTALSSITPTGDTSGGPQRRTTPLTQAAYYRVLIKGERLAPKPGRADDFSWMASKATGKEADRPKQ